MRKSSPLTALVGGLLIVAMAQGSEAAPFAYITESGAANVKVIDIADHRVVADIPVGRLPGAVAINRAGTRAYVVNFAENTVSVIDTASHRVTATIPVGRSPTAIAVDPTGTRVYVVTRHLPLSDLISVIDATTNTIVASFGIRTTTFPTGLMMSPGGERLYLANTGSNGIAVIDTATHETVDTIHQGASPRAMAINAEGSRIFATFPNRVPQVVALDPVSHAVVTSANAPMGTPDGIALHPDGKRAYVLDSAVESEDGIGTVHVLDTVSLAVLATVKVGSFPAGIAVDPFGTRIYVTNGGSNTVSVIDAATNTVAAVIPVGRSPASHGNFIGPAKIFPGEQTYQGLWWKPSESGWGVSIAHQGDTLFAIWFTYDRDGSPLWLVMSNGARTGPATYSGTLYRTAGPWFATNPWPPAHVTATAVGSATLSFADSDNGTFTYTYRDVTQSKEITRQIFSSPVPKCTAEGTDGVRPPIFQDLWWGYPAGSQPGWGVSIAHQGDTLFATWFTYDASGKGQWLVMSNGVRTPVYAGGGILFDDDFTDTYWEGLLYRMSGPAFDADPWDPAKVTRTVAGAAGFYFNPPGSNSGAFRYQLDSLIDGRAIARQVFSAPATVCR